MPIAMEGGERVKFRIRDPVFGGTFIGSVTEIDFEREP